MPLLTGNDADEAFRAVQAIADAIPEPDASVTPGPTRGSSGWALFWAVYAETTGDDAARDEALAHVEAAVAGVAALKGGAPGLYASPVGVGWALGVLEGHLLDPEPAHNDVDELVLALLRKDGWKGSFDLIRGLAGFGIYGLSRLPREIGHDIVNGSISRLAERAVDKDGGLCWPAEMELEMNFRAEAFPDGYMDTGIAHGQSGPVAFLAKALRAGYADAKPLLEGSLAWLLAQDSGRRAGDAFPSLVPFEERPDVRPGPTRLAWCYGDPGVAAALVQAARALGDDALLARAVGIVHACADRVEPGVVDVGLCHGAAGLGHVFHRIGSGLGDDAALDLARHWFREAVAMRDPSLGAGGYLTYVSSDGEWAPWTTLLDGSGGAGLALMSALSDAPAWWDGLLAVDGCEP